jgi:CRISPR system Cascade subunit CasE
MILSRLTMNRSPRARAWIGNAYRVHQRLMMGCDGDPRLLFRIDEAMDPDDFRPAQILVQSQHMPNWQAAFGDFPVLAGPAETRAYTLTPVVGAQYRFRLMANPTVSRISAGDKRGRRMGVLREEDQRAWLLRKLTMAGLAPVDFAVRDLGLRRSQKSGGSTQTHLAVQFDGLGRCEDSETLASAMREGIGSAKGYGFGLLSLARMD